MTTCTHCNAENRAGAKFCGSCGAPLAVESSPVPPPEPAAPEAAAEQPPAEPTSLFAGGVWITAGLGSVQGVEETINQDSLLALSLTPLAEARPAPALGLFALADGMSRALGEIASRLAVQALAQGVIARVVLCELDNEPCLDETLAIALAESVEDANARLCAGAQHSGGDLASTLVAVLLRDDLAVVASVGDSRAYHWGGGTLRQVTTDHSVVERLLETGQISAEEAAAHPQRGLLYRSLGDRLGVEVDTFALRLAPGDRLLLCCDGVWQSLSIQALKEILAAGEPQQACDQVICRARAAGAADNASALVVEVQDAALRAGPDCQERGDGAILAEQSDQTPGGE